MVITANLLILSKILFDINHDSVIILLMKNTFAIRCFRNDKRKLTHQLTKREARIFQRTALHLAKYLKKEYSL
jgi:hypothetical protein